MSTKVVLGIVIGSLILAMGVIGGLRIFSKEEILLDQELIDSILDWETIVSEIPKLAGYEVKEGISIRGEKGGRVTILPDSPFLWLSIRSVSEDEPFRAFTVNIGLYETEAALQEQINVIPLSGYNVTTNEVTTGFLEGSISLKDIRGGTHRDAFAAKGRLWVRFIVTTDFGADPFAEMAELVELIEVVKERIINVTTEF